MTTKTAPTTPETNGTPQTPEFPVESFREAAKHLRRPFTPEAVKFKVQTQWAGGGMVVAHIDARLVIERLNLVIPQSWFDAYEPTPQGTMWCHLTVDGIVRSDVGEGEGKGLVSDALKRAGVKFGIGVSLYAIPRLYLYTKDGNLKQKEKDTGRGKKLITELTPAGEKVCRDRYREWLEKHGIGAFGEPLNHGDVLDAQGDVETDEIPVPDETPPAPPSSLPDALVNELASMYASLIKSKGTDPETGKPIPPTWSKETAQMHFTAAGATFSGELSTPGKVKAAVRTLSPEKAQELRNVMADLMVES